MSIAKITLIKAGLLLAVLALIDCIPHELAHAISTNSIAKQSSKPLVFSLPSFRVLITPERDSPSSGLSLLSSSSFIAV